MFFRLLLVALLWSALARADETLLEVIALNYRSVEEVMPILQPFVGEDGALSGMSGQLIVRATPARMSQIRKILGEIDTLPKRLRIVVRQGGRTDQQGHGVEVSGEARVGDVRVTVPSHGDRGSTVEAGGVRARIWNSDKTKQDEDVQEVQVLEGRPAFIRTGISVPLKETTVVQHGATSRVIESTSYKEIGTGFYVVPRLSGERVLLEISPQKEQLISGRNKSIETQRLVTTVSGRLGEWIELGGISQRNEGGEAGWVHGAGQTSSDSRQVWVRVEALP